MTKAKNGNKVNRQYFVVLGGVFIFLLVLIGVLLPLLSRQSDQLWKYKLLETIDNQACRYLYNQPAVNGSFDLNVDAKYPEPKLKYTCLTGEKVGARVIQGKSIGGYEFGASVLYFRSNKDAEKFAGEKLNPLRYWGVDEEGQRKGIPQTSLFTFIVTDEARPYFDAYTVKANAVLRVSLPCTGGDPNVCYDAAQKILQRELKGINVL